MDVLEATLQVCGEVTFTSREVGRLADTEPYILNTALYYALGLARGRYLNTGYKPTYLEDTADIAEEVYLSPAVPVEGTSPEFVTSTYNATRDEYVEIHYSAQDDPYQKQNLPSFGRRRSLAAGTVLRFFAIPRGGDADALASELPTYLRLGKKRGKARLDVTRREAEERSGSFQLGHPIGGYDYEPTPLGNVATKSMKPTPLILRADYEGDYLRIDRSAAERGPNSIALPRNLEFLTRKR
jgi:CRISPR-associated protein Csc1